MPQKTSKLGEYQNRPEANGYAPSNHTQTGEFASDGECATNTAVREAATKYIRDGFAVIPLRRGRKDPALPRGHDFLSRPATPQEFEDFDFGNLGIPTGDINKIVVLDVDSEEGMEWVKEQGGHPPTRIHKTRRGYHIFFKHPGGHVRNMTGAGAIAPGVELKGDGGYVVAPPSVVDDKP